MVHGPPQIRGASFFLFMGIGKLIEEKVVYTHDSLLLDCGILLPVFAESSALPIYLVWIHYSLTTLLSIHQLRSSRFVSPSLD